MNCSTIFHILGYDWVYTHGYYERYHDGTDTRAGLFSRWSSTMSTKFTLIGISTSCDRSKVHLWKIVSVRRCKYPEILGESKGVYLLMHCSWRLTLMLAFIECAFYTSDGYTLLWILVSLYRCSVVRGQDRKCPNVVHLKFISRWASANGGLQDEIKLGPTH